MNLGATPVQLSNARGVRLNKHQLKSERTRLTILDAAEPLFAPHGLVGVSMRQIAAAAGVDLSLVAYHFESKVALYNAVVDRIMLDFTRRRTELLDELERAETKPSAVELFDLLITAWFEIRFGRAPHQARLILLGFNLEYQPHVEGEWPSDPFAKRLLAAVARAEPGQTTEYIHWTYHCFTGAIVYFMTSGDRIERLSGAHCDIHSQDAIRGALLQQVRNACPAKAGRRKPAAAAAQ
jgi:AcrR family transcriptional regulator